MQRTSRWTSTALCGLFATTILSLAFFNGVMADEIGVKVPEGFEVTEFAGDNLAHDIYSMTIDSQGRVVVAGQAVKLTSHEYRLIAYLMHHQGRIISRSEIIEHLYDQDFDRDSNTIEVFVGRLRKKLGVDIIKTIRGLGYLVEPPTAM